MTYSIAIIGLGYVGLPLAMEFAKKYQTIGFDIDSTRVRELNEGYDRTNEVSRDDLRFSTLTVTSKLSDIANCNFYIVTVPTPIDDSRNPNFTPLLKATEMIANMLQKGDVVVFESTVYPGATEELCVPILETMSGLQYNRDFFVGYSPERINPGDKINTLTKTVKITSGSNSDISEVIDKLYSSIISAGTYKARTIKTAEAAKVIENTQRDVNIAFVNELALIFQGIGLDTAEVLEAASTKWNFLPFKPGLVGGHCIGVDPYYLIDKCKQHSIDTDLIIAARNVNEKMSKITAVNILKQLLATGDLLREIQIGVLGLTFKDNCPDLRNSKVFDLINELSEWGASVMIFDPLADKELVETEYGMSLSKLESFKNLDAVIVAVAHTEFKKLTPKDLKAMLKPNKDLVADLKSIYNKEKLSRAGLSVFRL